MKITLNVNRWPLWVVIVLVSVVPVGMLLVDYFTRTDFDFLVFYLIPLLMVTWRWGRWPGYLFAMGGVIFHSIADRLTQPVYTYPGFFYWNLVEYFIVLNLFVIMLTRLKTALRQFREANEKLQEALRLESEFLRMAAHDLKNPLTCILGYSDLLMRADMAQNPTEVVESAQSIHTSARRMLNLIRNLLDVSKYESGQFQPAWADVDLMPITNRLIAQASAVAASKQIALHNEISRATWVRADPLLIEQAMENLLSNAIKFSSAGKAVYVRSHSRDGCVCWEVQDQGPGLSAQDQVQLFKKFARLKPQPTGGENSTGLGLSIVKLLVEAMAGRVECASEVGRGATFTITLPCAKPTEA